jgi:hypothetical protein
MYIYIYIITNPKKKEGKNADARRFLDSHGFPPQKCSLRPRPLEQLCLQRLTAGAKSAEMIREIIKFRGVEKTH